MKRYSIYAAYMIKLIESEPSRIHEAELERGLKEIYAGRLSIHHEEWGFANHSYTK